MFALIDFSTSAIRKLVAMCVVPVMSMTCVSDVLYSITDCGADNNARRAEQRTGSGANRRASCAALRFGPVITEGTCRRKKQCRTQQRC